MKFQYLLILLIKTVFSLQKKEILFPRFIESKNPDQPSGFAGGGDSGEFTRWNQPQEHMLVPLIVDIQGDYNPFVAPDIKKFRKSKMKIDNDLKYKMKQDEDSSKYVQNLQPTGQNNGQSNDKENSSNNKEDNSNSESASDKKNDKSNNINLSLKDNYDPELIKDIKLRIFFPIFGPEEGKNYLKDLDIESLTKKYPNVDFNTTMFGRLVDELIQEKIKTEGVNVLDHNQIKEKIKHLK